MRHTDATCSPAITHSNMHSLPWTVALIAALTLFGVTASLWAWQRGRPAKLVALPTEWALTARPIFSAGDRKLHRLLREALPNHIVLSKLPLVRFCQPTDPGEVRYWFNLLGANHVTFALCSTNGRVLAAIDLETDRGASSRVMKIKQSVLAACGVPYLRCAIDQLPSAAELQMLVLSSGPDPRELQFASAAPRELRHVHSRASDTALPHPRAHPHHPPAHATHWHDSSMHWDSFFAPDTSADSFGISTPATANGLAAEPRARPPSAAVQSVFAPESPAHSGNYADIAIGAPRFSAST